MRAARNSAVRTRRINLRATERQESLILTGAVSKGVTLTDFILDSACSQAEQVLADKREFVAAPAQWRAFLDALDRPARVKPGLAQLFLRRRPSNRGRASR